jgi:hypothetical protein
VFFQLVIKYFADMDRPVEMLSKQLWLILQRTITSVRKEPTIIVTVLRIIEREERLHFEFWGFLTNLTVLITSRVRMSGIEIFGEPFNLNQMSARVKMVIIADRLGRGRGRAVEIQTCFLLDILSSGRLLMYVI